MHRLAEEGLFFFFKVRFVEVNVCFKFRFIKKKGKKFVEKLK